MCCILHLHHHQTCYTPLGPTNRLHTPSFLRHPFHSLPHPILSVLLSIRLSPSSIQPPPHPQIMPYNIIHTLWIRQLPSTLHTHNNITHPHITNCQCRHLHHTNSRHTKARRTPSILHRTTTTLTTIKLRMVIPRSLTRLLHIRLRNRRLPCRFLMMSQRRLAD